MTNYPAPGRRHIYTHIIENIRDAKKNIYITMPYFVPTHTLVHTIKLAAERGVLVKIIIPEKSDYYSVDLGARSYFKTLLESGVRIFLYSGNMIHSKAITIDNEWATVGSLNLDRASLLYNFEANIVSTDHEFADELAKHFVNDIRDSKEVTPDEWRKRFFLEKIPEVLIRLVREFL
jgi:cardiolipin synthase